jgi:hypothetical protein
MAQQLASPTQTTTPGHLLASDPSDYTSAAIPVKKAQGVLKQGTLMKLDGTKAAVVADVDGLLMTPIDTTNLAEDGAGTIWTQGRFVLEVVQQVNPTVVLDAAARAALLAKNITFEQAYY